MFEISNQVRYTIKYIKINLQYHSIFGKIFKPEFIMTAKIRKILPYALISLSAVILFIKCFYSFCWSDETFYFSTCHRFFTGDSIFLHEWFPTQLSSVVLLPFYAAFMIITGSNAGILLYFRILFVIMSTVNALVMYNILKQHVSRFCALIC